MLICMMCGENHPAEMMYKDRSGRFVCDACRSEVVLCCVCGNFSPLNSSLIHDSGMYCGYCSQYANASIWGHGTKPVPQFYGRGLDHLGVELEIDQGRDRSECAQKIKKLNYPLYIETDGSLHNGLEIISHPCTTNYHLKKFPWEKIFHIAGEFEFKSHEAETCGLHVHISRALFGGTPEVQRENIGKFLLIFNYGGNISQIKNFARRTDRQMRWCKFFPLVSSDFQNGEGVYSYYWRNGNASDRYYAINLQNQNTVEVRIFRGTLNRKTFYASLQFCRELAEIAKKPFKTVRGLGWNAIREMMFNSQFPELKDYISTRGI